MIHAMLWLFSLKAAVDFYNILDLNEDSKLPIELLIGTIVDLDFKDFHMWGFPVFVLDHRN